MSPCHSTMIHGYAKSQDDFVFTACLARLMEQRFDSIDEIMKFVIFVRTERIHLRCALVLRRRHGPLCPNNVPDLAPTLSVPGGFAP